MCLYVCMYIYIYTRGSGRGLQGTLPAGRSTYPRGLLIYLYINDISIYLSIFHVCIYIYIYVYIVSQIDRSYIGR